MSAPKPRSTPSALSPHTISLTARARGRAEGRRLTWGAWVRGCVGACAPREGELTRLGVFDGRRRVRRRHHNVVTLRALRRIPRVAHRALASSERGALEWHLKSVDHGAGDAAYALGLASEEVEAKRQHGEQVHHRGDRHEEAEHKDEVGRSLKPIPEGEAASQEAEEAEEDVASEGDDTRQDDHADCVLARRLHRRGLGDGRRQEERGDGDQRHHPAGGEEAQ